MPKAKPIPEGVKEAARATAASRKKGTPGTRALLVSKYDFTERQAAEFLKREGPKIDDMRGSYSKAALGVAALTLVRIHEKLADDDVMAETDLKDLAMTAHKLTDSAVTAAEGHKALVQFNFPQTMALREKLDQHDARLRQLKEANPA